MLLSGHATLPKPPTSVVLTTLCKLVLESRRTPPPSKPSPKLTVSSEPQSSKLDLISDFPPGGSLAGCSKAQGVLNNFQQVLVVWEVAILPSEWALQGRALNL